MESPALDALTPPCGASHLNLELRGSDLQGVMKRFQLRERVGAQPQTYALGLKEVWTVAPEKHKPGTVVHTIGYPLDASTYGGSFLYHMHDGMLALG